jgi:addiction module HigA family antidote
MTAEVDCSSTLFASSEPSVRAIWCLRMSRGYSITKRGRRSPLSSPRWMSSGTMRSGVCATLVISAFRKTERASSFWDIAEKEPPRRYFLSQDQICRIVNGRTAVTAEMALKLGATFGTTPEFWLNAQRAVDLQRAAARLPSLPRSLRKAS